MALHQRERTELSEPVLATEVGVTYRLATTQDELEQAFRLVRNAYVRVGLHAEEANSLRVTKYHLLPGARVFVAVTRDGGYPGCPERVIGTVTVVPDGSLGLPAEAVAAEEIGQQRRDGGRAAEFIALAADDEGTKNRVIMKLFRLAYEYCRVSGVSTIYASLTERHIGFYRRFLGFRPVGELTSYEMGNGMPVQVHYIDVALDRGRIESRSRVFDRDPSWRWFIQNDLEDVLEQACAAKPWTRRLVQHFILKCRELQQQLDRKTVELLNVEYLRHGYAQTNYSS